MPVRLPPLPGEALDSWLETYAHLLHAGTGDIFQLAGLGPRWDDAARANGHKPWAYRLDPPELAALSAVSGVPAATLAGMTLARYEGTGLAATGTAAGLPRTPRWWRQPIGSRFCPRCLAANDGRWMLSWRLPWTFACTGHQGLLADICPACGRRHAGSRTGQARHPGRCDATGLPLPPARPRRGAPPCTRDLAGVDTLTLPRDGYVLRAQQHIDALIAGLLNSRSQPADLAGLQQHLDDIYAIARAALSALHAPVQPPPAVSAVLAELVAGPGDRGSESTSPLTTPWPGGAPRQYAAVTAFGTTIADIMLHGRHHDPDPDIARWLTGAAAGRGKDVSPANMMARWKNTSPAIQGALLKQLGSRLDVFYQLRYGTVASSPRKPVPGAGPASAAAVPALLWRGWALRLMPPGGFETLPSRAALSVLLAIACGAGEDYRTAQRLLGQQPADPSRFSSFTARLREQGALDPVLSALCQLASELGRRSAPIDYARRRRLQRLCQAQLDTAEWRRTRFFLTHPDTWAWRRHIERTGLSACPGQEKFARLRLVEMLTGTHPYYLPPPLTLPARHGQKYAEFVFCLPAPLAACLHQQARRILQHAEIDEPPQWEPPFGWVTGIAWPGPHPDDVSPQDLQELTRAGHPVAAIAARLGTTAEHIRLAAARHPAPELPLPASRSQTQPLPAAPPDAEQLRSYTSQGFGPRKIGQITGCSQRHIRQLLIDAGLRNATPPPGPRQVDAGWLREQYEINRRSLKDITAETGVPVADLATVARSAGIAVRHGINGHAHPLAALGGPDDFPPAVWAAFARPGADKRIRRLLAAPGHPSLARAARHLGTKHETLASQIAQLEAAVGTKLLCCAPGAGITLTPVGERFAHDVQPVLDSLEQAKSRDNSS
jgi:hypothetical protein